MRYRVALLAALAGCNSIFDLRPTQQLDAAYFDAPLDAPYACPMIGSAPAFSAALHQHLLQDCAGYASAADGTVVASCVTNLGGNRGVYQGESGQELQPAAGIPLPDAGGGDGYDLPRISPDGQRLLVRHVDYNTGVSDFQYYARTTSGTWSALAAPPFADRPFASTLATGPTGLHVLVAEFISTSWTEWIDEGGTWRMAQTHTGASFGVDPIYSIAMTSDGLRALMSGQSPETMLYTDRASIEGPFSTAKPMPTLPVSSDAVMTADCARVYLSGLGYVFYVQQQ